MPSAGQSFDGQSAQDGQYAHGRHFADRQHRCGWHAINVFVIDMDLPRAVICQPLKQPHSFKKSAGVFFVCDDM